MADKRKARGGEGGLVGSPDTPEVLLEKLGFARKRQFQKVRARQWGKGGGKSCCRVRYAATCGTWRGCMFCCNVRLLLLTLLCAPG